MRALDRRSFLALASFAFGLAACSAQLESNDSIGRTAQALGDGAAGAPPWVGTWATAPQDCGGGTTFDQQTLRQIVHTSIGGSSARIQLSNVFGSDAVTVDDVHIAKRTSDSSIDTASDRAIKFGGQSSVTIAPGTVAISDAVDLALSALSDVAVSLYFPNQTTTQSCHQSAFQTSFMAAGDASGNGDLVGAQTTGSYFLLTSLDVQSPAAAGALVTLGASITDGFNSSSDSNRRWPNDLAARMANAGIAVGVLNEGISGNQLLVDGAGQSALHRFERDALAQSGVKWVVFADDPINDLGNNHPTTDQLIAGLEQLIATAHQAGVKLLCATLTPFQGASYWSPTEETSRQAYNAYVMTSNSGCDAVVDMDKATHDPANPTQYLPGYDSGDHLHPNEDGLKAMANAVDLALFAVPPPADAGSSDGGAALDASSHPGGGSDHDASAGSGNGVGHNDAGAGKEGEGASDGGATGSGSCSMQAPRAGERAWLKMISLCAFIFVLRRARRTSSRRRWQGIIGRP